MKVYLVGGAVRDALLGRVVKERDWVVVGATPEQLTRDGYLPVGRDFPVFLHPQTREEYALARRERKTGPGYRGFVTQYDPGVTLQEDLQRRDLTINAMAQDDAGQIIDPWGGRADLAARRLRHVSDAFAEDPVRILRVARFAARYAPLGFSVDAGTNALMQRMVRDGEAAALVAERVWKELEKALQEPRPEVCIEVLRGCGALRVLLPEVDALFGVPQPEKWHPEIDTGVHALLALRLAADAGASLAVRFALLVHDLGKALTPRHKWPSHPGHEAAGVPLIERLCVRLRVPNELRELALLGARYHTHVHRAAELRPSTVLELLENCDAFRRPERFAEFLQVCEFDARGRTGLESRSYPQAARIALALASAAAVTLGEQDRSGRDGRQIGERLRQLRLAAVTAALSDPAAETR